MKRTMSLVAIYAALGVLALTGCGGNKPKPSTDSSGTSTSQSTGPTGATVAADFVTADMATRTQILGKLEKFAVDNAVTGLPLYENGGFGIYASRIVKGVEKYIPGYGFGTLREGYLNGTLPGENGQINPTFYHQTDSTDPHTALYWNSKDAQVGDIRDSMTASYFGNKMNAAKNGYDWYGVLSNKDRPYIVKNGTASEATDPNEVSDTWRIYVRTGETGGVQFRNNSSDAARKAFDGTYATLEDYVTPFKIMLTKKNGFFRGSELANQKGKYGIKGATAYYNGSSAGFDEELWKNVGIKSGTDETGDYLEFTLLAPANRFYAMYGLSSTLYSPIPMAFWNLVTNDGANPKAYESFNGDKTLSPVDNSVSVGPYYLKSWSPDTSIVYERNASWKEYNWATGEEYQDIYRIPGLYTKFYPGIDNDENLLMKEFIAGNIDSCSIPLDYFDEYKDDPRARQTTGNSVWKLNLNTCTQAEWEAKFGENGYISQTAREDYYDVKPWMSNDSFIKGLFYSIDRNTFGGKRGYPSSINYFASAYLSDPENGIAYNNTPEHAAALSHFWGDTIETGGFSLPLSQAAFDTAIEEMLADGSIKKNQKLTIDIYWMYNSQIKTMGNEIAGYIQDAFNSASKAKANGLTLEVTQQAGALWSDVYYKHLMTGQFDLGFGSINGNALDPLNFLEVLKSDNSSGMTLNWGPDTSIPNIEFNGKLFSFDALWAAADHGVVAYKGEEVPAGKIDKFETTREEGEEGSDGELDIHIEFTDGLKFLQSVADGDADVQAILDSGDYDALFESFEISDGVTGMQFDELFTVNEEGGLDAAYGFYEENAQWFSVDFDLEAGTIDIALKDELLAYCYGPENPYYDMFNDPDPKNPYAGYWSDRLYVDLHFVETIGDLETEILVKAPSLSMKEFDPETPEDPGEPETSVEAGE